jgi:hypothetical protein
MQTIIQVVCTPGISLRDSIAKDRRLGDDDFEVIEEKRTGRNPGWTTIKSVYPDRQGSIKIQWLDSADILLCRVINKGGGKPNLIVGDFVDYLLKRYPRRLRSVTILPGRTASRGT